MKFNDAIIGALLLLLAGAVLVDIQGYPKIPGQNVGPGAFPGLLASLLAVCGALLVIKGLRARPGVAWLEVAPWVRSSHHLLNFFVIVGALLFTILFINSLGFILCSVIVLCAMFWSLRVRPVLIVPVALAVTLFIHTIFYFGLRVPLPWGVLLPVAW